MKMQKELHGRAIALMSGLGRAAPAAIARFKSRLVGKRVCARLCRCDKGNAIVEFALILPPLMMLLTGIVSFGLALVNFEALTHGVAQGGQYLVTTRPFTTDPCLDVWNKLTAAAPTLNPANITLTLTPQGGSAVTADSTGHCAGSQTILAYESNIEVAATYPCGFGIYGYNFAPGCKLQANVTEYEF